MSNPGNLDQSLPSQRVVDLLRVRAKRQPQAPALTQPGLCSISFQELLASVGGLARALGDSGVRPGHRVGLVMPNASMTATAILGVLDCSTLVPFNPDYRESEFESLYQRTRVDVLLTSEGPDHPGRKTAETLGIPVVMLVPSTTKAGCFELKSPATMVLRELADTPDTSGVALVLHTSGSTAAPKIVPLSHGNLLASISNLVVSLQLSAHDRCLNMMPMFHIGGLLDLLLAPLSVGAYVITPPVNSGEMCLRCLREYSPTWYQAVPTMLRDLVATLKASPGLIRDIPPLRLIRSVSSALPNRLLHEVESLLETTVIEIYGMTESAGVICSNPLGSGYQKQGSVGIPQGCEVGIINRAGERLPAGQRGEVIVKGASLISGYEDPGRDQISVFIDDYLRTGDEGYIDNDGYLYLCGRIKEMINRGGEKISPMEIDRVAESHPTVQAAAAFAVSHPSLGEEVALAIVKHRNVEFDEPALLDFIGQQLSRHKMPRRIFHLEKLPRAAGGKLQRHLLAGLLMEQDNQREEPPWAMPVSPLARELAALWERALDIKQVGLHDNFFDLGGDSLSAAAIMSELVRRYPRIPPSILYDYPTLDSLEKRLLEHFDPGMPIDEAVSTSPEVIDSLRRFMGAWKGYRLDQHSLIVGRNTEGNRTPLFWCVNGFSEFDALALQMHDDQPVYGLRSLYDTGHKSDGATLQVARAYFEELLQIQPRGPYLLGGFCEGGKVAFLLAQMLRARGETVASLLLQEQFVASPYSGRVAMLICKPGRNNPYHSFVDATRGWRKYYSGEIQLYRLNGRHKDCYLAPDIEFIARQIQREIQRALAYSHDDQLDRRNRLQRLPLDAYRARLEASPPARVMAGLKFEVPVSLTNLSTCDWMPTINSGLVLAARWLKRSGETRVWVAGTSEIPQALRAGDSITISLSVRAPIRIESCYLELDLVDDGVAWFSAMGSQVSRHLVSISILPFST